MAIYVMRLSQDLVGNAPICHDCVRTLFYLIAKVSRPVPSGAQTSLSIAPPYPTSLQTPSRDIKLFHETICTSKSRNLGWVHLFGSCTPTTQQDTFGGFFAVLTTGLRCFSSIFWSAK